MGQWYLSILACARDRYNISLPAQAVTGVT